MTSFLTAFAMVFIAEMGDKTQLFLISLSSKFKIKSIIIGVASAIAVLNAAAVALGYFIGSSIDASVVKLIAGGAFLIFAYTTLLPKKEEEEKTKRGKGAVIAVFLSFLLAELGDKTQLMTLTLSAEAKASGASFKELIFIFIACSAGLLAADMIGMLAGFFLSKKIPEKAMSAVSFVIFTLFGIYTIYEGVSSISSGEDLPILITVLAVSVSFALLCALTLIIMRNKDLKERSVRSGR